MYLLILLHCLLYQRMGEASIGWVDGTEEGEKESGCVLRVTEVVESD